MPTARSRLADIEGPGLGTSLTASEIGISADCFRAAARDLLAQFFYLAYPDSTGDYIVRLWAFAYPDSTGGGRVHYTFKGATQVQVIEVAMPHSDDQKWWEMGPYEPHP